MATVMWIRIRCLFSILNPDFEHSYVLYKFLIPIHKTILVYKHQDQVCIRLNNTYFHVIEEHAFIDFYIVKHTVFQLGFSIPSKLQYGK